MTIKLPSVFLLRQILEANKFKYSGHCVDFGRCIYCGMPRMFAAQFPCPAREPMIAFYQLAMHTMFTFSGQSFMKIKESKAFCFDLERVQDFAPDAVIKPVETEDLRLFKVRVERMVTDQVLVRKIFSHKDIQRLGDLKPGTHFTDGVRRFTKLNYDNPKINKAFDSNYHVCDFDPGELFEVVQ